MASGWVAEYSELLGFGNLLRSAEVEYMTLHMRESMATAVVERLGALGAVHFSDLNGDMVSFKRAYTPLIRRCDELEKKLAFFVEECARTNTPAPAPRTQEEFLAWRTEQTRLAEHYGCPLLEYWESIINERHRDYLGLKAEREKNAAVLASAGARRHVIEAAVKWFDCPLEELEGGGSSSSSSSSGSGGGGGSSLEPFRGAGLRAATASVGSLEAGRAAPAAREGGEGEDVAFRHIAGLLRSAEQSRFARIVFRASMGHAAVRFSPIEGSLMDERGDAARMSVFAVLYRGRALTPKLERICAAFGAATHALPNFAHPAEVSAALADTKALIATSITWLKSSAAMAAHTLGYLRLAVTQWRMGIAREKAVAAVLNGFCRNGEAGGAGGAAGGSSSASGTVSAAGWVLKASREEVRAAIGEAHAAAGAGGRCPPYRLDFFAVVPGESAAKRFGWSEHALQDMRCAGSGEYIGLPVVGGGGGAATALASPVQHLDLSGYIGVEGSAGAAAEAAVAAAGGANGSSSSASSSSSSSSSSSEGRTLALPSAPPTYFPSNKFTVVFQGIVNTYGIPRYGEVNPAIFTVVTFPFLFGVMFGDFGHALLLTLAALWMVWKEKELALVDNEMFRMAFGGRYMICLMGFFSMYCGLIYNDFFSLGMTVMGASRWWYPACTVAGQAGCPLPCTPGVAGCPAAPAPPFYPGTTSRLATWSTASADVYPFGIDPEWHRSDNDLLFFNSLKMKMSVVLGITQMTFGLFLRASNAVHFKNSVDFWCEAVPQLVFMISMFGYMVFLIMAKWCINWFGGPSESPGSPPALIDALINIALKPSSIDPPDRMFTGQGSFQQLVLLTAFATVPVMLFVKPYILSRPHAAAEAAAAEAKKRDPAGAAAAEAAAAAAGGEGGHGSEGGAHHHSFGEHFIHQAIETIEFVLGTVSNTASYLRLWALSLAHSQLATVFWERALVASVETENFVMIFIGYAVYAGITTGVLLMMDVLECFLHALRLHWVEFQNKFFKADGHIFKAFSFAAISIEKEES